MINYWTADGKGGFLKEHFAALLDAYTQYIRPENVDWDAVFAGSYMGMLGWLEYNMKRALGIEATTADEIQLGKEQVIGTIGALYDYQEKARQMKKYLTLSL